MASGNTNKMLIFDAKVFNHFAPMGCSVSLPQCYRCAELEKKRKYEERICEVEHKTFSPLAFSCTGRMGPLTTVLYQCIATTLSEKTIKYLIVKLFVGFIFLLATSLSCSMFERL